MRKKLIQLHTVTKRVPKRIKRGLEITGTILGFILLFLVMLGNPLGYVIPLMSSK